MHRIWTANLALCKLLGILPNTKFFERMNCPGRCYHTVSSWWTSATSSFFCPLYGYFISILVYYKLSSRGRKNHQRISHIYVFNDRIKVINKSENKTAFTRCRHILKTMKNVTVTKFELALTRCRNNLKTVET